MNYTIKFLLVILSILFIPSCKKEKRPTLTTTEVINITGTSATSGGTITDEGSGTITERGVCWSINTNPSLADDKTQDGAGAESYSSNISNLNTFTAYYVRAYATNSAGTGYGNQIHFKTSRLVPSVTTSNVTLINSTSVSSGGVITDDGGASVTARGVCWSTFANPSIADNKTIDGSETGTFTSSLTGLTPGTTYFLRAYATNSVGTAYGNELTFTTAIALGDTYQGGYVFYILQASDLNFKQGETHGLIAAPADQGEHIIWGCTGTMIVGAEGKIIGTGNQNTIDIINGCSEADIAARLSYDLELSGYDDWYLPSADELYTLMLNRQLVGGLSREFYWTSSQYDINHAWIQSFTASLISTTWAKNNSMCSVRAIRSF